MFNLKDSCLPKTWIRNIQVIHGIIIYIGEELKVYALSLYMEAIENVPSLDKKRSIRP